MAAGLGFKTFTTGEVLTAGDVNGYLMQGINVFATTAARDAAITAPAEGQFAFTKDTNGLWYYDGAAWVASGATGDIEGVTAGVGISGGGTSGTVTVTNSMATAIDAKGDLVPGTGADTFARLAVGANDTVLTADSTAATGLKWATVGGASGPAFSATKSGGGTQSISASTWTKITYNTENFDTDSCFSSSRFTPTKAGYYQINLNNQIYSPTANSLAIAAIYKNGTIYYTTVGANIAGNYGGAATGAIIYFNGTTDYVEGYAYAGGTSPEIIDSASTTGFNGVWIRS